MIAALLLAGTAAALRAPRATVGRTIGDRNGDNRLEVAAGELDRRGTPLDRYVALLVPSPY